MNAEQIANAKADLVEKRAQEDIKRARARFASLATEMRDRMARVVERLEDPGEDLSSATGVCQQAARFEEYRMEYLQKRDALRSIRAMRRAFQEPVDGSAGGGR